MFCTKEAYGDRRIPVNWYITGRYILVVFRLADAIKIGAHHAVNVLLMFL